MKTILTVITVLWFVGSIYFGYSAEKSPLNTGKRRNNTIACITCLAIMIIFLFAMGVIKN